MMKNKQQTRIEKIGNGPRLVADAFKTGRKKLVTLQPKKAKVLADTAKYSGAVSLWLMEYFTRLFNGVALDNPLLRAMERGLKNKKKAGFAKNNPALASYMLYYIIPLMVWGGVKTEKAISEKIEDYKTERELQMAKQGTFASFLERVEPITPMLIADLIAKEGVRVNEQGLHCVYDDATGKILKPGQKPKGKATIGFGCTRLKDGTPVTSYTKPITTEEAYELAYHHIVTGETFFLMYCYDIAFADVDINTTEKVLGLGSVFYNAGSKLVENPDNRNHKERNAYLRELYKEYGYALPDTLVLDLFKKYPVNDMRSFGEDWLTGQSDAEIADNLGEFVKNGSGLYWRRWLEAGLLTGEITSDMLLDCPAHGMPEFYKYMNKKKSAFFTGKAGERKVNYDTYALFREWLKNPVDKKGASLASWKKVVDYLPKDVAEKCREGKCVYQQPKTAKFKLFGKNNEKITEDNHTKIEKDTYVIGYEDEYNSALGSFRKKNFDEAAEKYEQMILRYPENALLYNDLALTYIHLEKYDDAIMQANKVFDIGDKSQYGAANYNIGLAFEKKGKIKKAIKYYQNAVANGNRNAMSAINRLKKILDNEIGKKIAFNSGIQQIRQKNAKQDIFLYGKETTFNA